MTAIYVHIPFCKQKCHYCDFNSYPGLESLFDAYVSALIKEIDSRAGIRAEEIGAEFKEMDGKADSLAPQRIQSIYFGGGTPVLIGPDRVAHIIDRIKACYDIDLEAEITIEANPEAISFDAMRLLKDAGVNRVSIGFQSLDDECLKILGRKHTASKAIASFLETREAGFDNINIDLIFGVPTQSLANWALNLEQVAALNPEHISCYALSIEEGTLLERMIDTGEVESPDEEIQADMMIYTRESLIDSGYEHYEVSNYAKPGKSCRHNLAYWNNDDYLGLGAGAHSKINGVRYANLDNPKKYIEAVGTGDRSAFIKSKNALSAEEQLGDAIFLGLRKINGININEFKKRYGCDILKVYVNEIEELARDGLLVVSEDVIRLSGKGILLGNEVFARFV
jgi:oxygen-independent coproporphyrinogen-3 oxidase